MPTNLFGKYYTDPKKQYIYTNISCKNNSNDNTNFKFSGDKGVIVNGAVELANLDISSIFEYITDWKSETRIIEPYEFVYYRGFSEGLSYQRNVFAKVPEELASDEDFEYVTGVEFTIKYYKNACPFIKVIHGEGNLEELIKFTEAVQEELDKNEIPVTITYEDGAVIFTSTVLGYDFYISSDLHTNAIKLISDYIDPSFGEDGNSVYLYDFKQGFVPPKKYRNGAFRGILLKPTYPQFNDGNILDEQRALKIAHLKNRIEFDTPVLLDGGFIVYDKQIKDVIDSYHEVGEMEKFNRWRNPDSESYCESPWEEWYEQPSDYNKSEIKGIKSFNKNENITGLYGFINWVQRNDAWTKFGSFYSIITPKDAVDSDNKNLVDSFIVYNPNPFPVQVSSMVFA